MNINVTQDGAEFYYSIPGVKGVQTATAPFKVADFDLKKAQKARRWFVEFICYDSGFIPNFYDN